MKDRRERRPRRKLKFFLIGLLALVFVIVAAVSVVVSWRGNDGSTYLSELLSGALSSEGNTVRIGSVEGALSSNIVLRDLTMTDKNGVWLRLDRAELVWSRSALLSRTLSVDLLELGHLDIFRKPIIEAQQVKEKEENSADAAGFPELPVKAEIKNVRLVEARLGEPLLGVGARLTVNGSVELGAPSDGLKAQLAVKRLDAPGAIGAVLSYVPETKALLVDFSHDEPAGGLAARLMKLEGLPPVHFEVKGRGVLDDFKATMTYAAGDKLEAAGTATLVRDGAARRLDIRSDAKVEALLPQPVSMLVAGITRIDGRVVFADDKSIAISGLSIASDLAKFNLAGSVAADRALDLNLTAEAVKGPDGRTRAAGGELERFQLNAAVKGAAMAPSVQAKFDIAGLSTPQGGLKSGIVTVLASPEGSAGEPSRQRWNLRADATLDGFAATQRQLSDATGGSLKLSLQATRLENGAFDIKVLDLATPTVGALYQGTVSERGADGTLKAVAPNLAAFSGITGRKLRGDMRITAKLAGDVGKTMTVDTDLTARELFLDTPAADGLLKGAVSLKGRTQLSEGTLTFDGIRVVAAHLAAGLDGSIGKKKADTRLQLVIDDLSQADARLKGKLSAEAAVTGSGEHPDIKLSLKADNAMAMDQPVRQLAFDVTAKDVLGALDATASLRGDIGNKPLTGQARVLRAGEQKWKLDGLDFKFGSASLSGGVSAENGLADGRVKIDAGNLSELSALALTKLSGAFNADIVLTSDNGRQGGRLIAKGRDIGAGGAAMKMLDADLTAKDLFSKPVLNGSLTGSNWMAGGEKIETVSVKAEGNASASSVTVQAVAQGLVLDGRAVIEPTDIVKVTLSGLSVRRGQKTLALAKPATFKIADGMVAISDLVIGANGGQVAASGTLGTAPGKDSNLGISFKKLPLSITAIAAPKLDLGGNLDGEVKISGPIAKPRGSYDLDIWGVITPEIRSAGLPPIDTGIKGQLKGDQTAFDAAISLGKAGRITVAGSMPFDPRGNMDIRVKGQVNAAAANSMLSAGGQQVAGTVNIDSTLRGQLDRPDIRGQAVLTNASFTDSLQGVKLTNIQGRVIGAGDTVTVERITAQTKNDGTITVAGRIELDPVKGFPGSFTINANRAELVSSELVMAVANMALTMNGPLAQKPRIAGRVDLVKMEVSLPNRLPATVQPLPNAKHIAPPPNVKARLEAQRKARQKAKKSSPFSADLDLTVNAPNQVFIRGQGVDAEVQGQLRIVGSSLDPKVNGGFDMRRGTLTIIGQRLEFTRGKLTFSGDLSPELDFLAQTQAGDVTAKVAVTGLASQPSFELSSTPELPRDEVLSRLLFAKSSGSLSAFQALQLAQAVAQLSGQGGPDVFNETRKALGLDSLDITTGASGGPAVGASRYINDRISVGVRAGANPEDNAATVNVDITKRLKLQGEVGSTGSTSVGVGAEWEY